MVQENIEEGRGSLMRKQTKTEVRGWACWICTVPSSLLLRAGTGCHTSDVHLLVELDIRPSPLGDPLYGLPLSLCSRHVLCGASLWFRQQTWKLSSVSCSCFGMLPSLSLQRDTEELGNYCQLLSIRELPRDMDNMTTKSTMWCSPKWMPQLCSFSRSHHFCRSLLFTGQIEIKPSWPWGCCKT